MKKNIWKTIAVFALLFISFASYAQDEEDPRTGDEEGDRGAENYRSGCGSRGRHVLRFRQRKGDALLSLIFPQDQADSNLDAEASDTISCVLVTC